MQFFLFGECDDTEKKNSSFEKIVKYKVGNNGNPAKFKHLFLGILMSEVKEEEADDEQEDDNEEFLDIGEEESK
ncbi:MAG: hypothetical protein AABX37_03920, partial [Nanoarchaeota archaeon]